MEEGGSYCRGAMGVHKEGYQGGGPIDSDDGLR